MASFKVKTVVTVRVRSHGSIVMDITYGLLKSCYIYIFTLV